MSPVALTLLLCFITAVSRIFLKLGMEKSNPLTGMTVSLVIGWATLVSFTFFLVPASSYHLEGILFFAMIGVIAPPVVRYLTYIGVHRVGASRSDPVRSLTPFFSILFAVLFLGESANRYILFGAAMIFLGVFTLSREQMGKDTVRAWKRSDLLFPLVAAIIAGAVANLRKYGSGLLESTLLGATVAASSALIVFGLFLLHDGRWKKIELCPRARKFFILSGLLTSITDVLDLVVLQRGKVTVVAPLLASSPIFIIALSHLFLKGVEKVSSYIIVGAIMIFAGIELIMVMAK